ncbi:hypothetical protein MIMGU_mgv1a017273mg [Erythranthe guttata]|uniref:Uncharacterized protein n=1 Tax=Erythranthe guttata TaxID=4155 RepID=A0A022QM73_ERYGU|nr:hypothetical protein MIMGU_mgv1a017273mg [Erythranthe guttata]
MERKGLRVRLLLPKLNPQPREVFITYRDCVRCRTHSRDWRIYIYSFDFDRGVFQIKSYHAMESYVGHRTIVISLFSSPLQASILL